MTPYLRYNVPFIIDNDNTIIMDVTKEVLSEIISVNDKSTFILSTDGNLSYNTDVKWFNSYEANYIKPIKNRIKKEFYTKAAWYSLDNVKNYISFLEETSSRKKMEEIVGVNIFYGVHGKYETISFKANTQTIFFVPTYANKTSVLLVNNDVTSFETILKNPNSITSRGNGQEDSLAADELTQIPPKRGLTIDN